MIAAKWEAIELELVRDGFLARVGRTMKPGRWRWCVAPLEHVLKWNRNVTDVPFSKGFTGTRERAIEMAEAAIVALKKAKLGQPIVTRHDDDRVLRASLRHYNPK